MTQESKDMVEMESALETCRHWKDATVSELRSACRYVPAALLLLIQRVCLGLCGTCPTKGGA